MTRAPTMTWAMRATTLGVVASATVAWSSCKVFEFPEGTCAAADLVAFEEPAARDACTTCLERREACDEVGRCGDDTDDCKARVRSAHACIIDAGRQAAKSEAACTDSALGANTAARDAYGAMRAHCGKACGLPTCALDKNATQLGAPPCDRCLTGACCEEINACYGDRTCRLIVECFARECLAELANGSAADRKDDPCADDAAPNAAVFDPNGASCTERCIGRFAGHDAPTSAARSQQPACLALRTRRCAVEARCGELCRAPDAPDANADAAADSPDAADAADLADANAD